MLAQLLRRLRTSTVLKVAARVGLVGRGVFYVMLAALAVSLFFVRPPADVETNSNGVLAQVGTHPVGLLLLVAAALGFAAFGVVRLAGAATDDRQGRWRRLGTAGQGLAYLAVATETASFLLGQRATGSEQQQRQAAGFLLGLPGGGLLIVGAGVVLVLVCCWQLVVAIRGHFAETLHLEQMSRRSRWLLSVTARVGIPARALAFLPIGVFLVVAGLRSDAQQAKGLDALLLELTVNVAGRVLVALVAAGFVVFAAYSFLEARFRRVSAGA